MTRERKAPAGSIGGPSLKTDWQTPEWLLEPVRAYFGGTIPLDVATAPDNPTHARRFYCPTETAHERAQARLFHDDLAGERAGHDGLELSWSPAFFCNPPYGRDLCARWLPRAAEQAREGAEGFLLISCARWEQAALHVAMQEANAVCFVRGRVDFVNPATGDAVKGNTYANMFLAFNVDWPRFAAAFAGVGWCYRLESTNPSCFRPQGGINQARAGSLGVPLSHPPAPLPGAGA